MLAIEALVAGYGDAVVLEGVDLELRRGETLAVLGRNGVGKTTLMLAIMGHVRCHSGRIALEGRDLGEVAAVGRAGLGIGWVPQERDIFASLTVAENLRVGARPGPFDLARVYRLLPRLEERRRNYGDQLSGGEQQMLAIGRALMVNPRLLLLDEPFEGLAPIIVEQLSGLIAALRDEGMSCLLVEQHAEAALALSDRAVVFERGRIVCEGGATDLLGRLDELAQLLAV